MHKKTNNKVLFIISSVLTAGIFPFFWCLWKLFKTKNWKFIIYPIIFLALYVFGSLNGTPTQIDQAKDSTSKITSSSSKKEEKKTEKSSTSQSKTESSSKKEETSSSEKKTSQSSSSTKSKKEDADAPIKLSDSDFKMSGKDFYKKYEDKIVEFDGVLIVARDAPSSLSILVFSTGKDGNDSFSDGSAFAMTLGKYDLPPLNQNWATEPNQLMSDLISSNSYPIVHVTGKVRGYDEERFNVDLYPMVVNEKAAVYMTGENWSK